MSESSARPRRQAPPASVVLTLAQVKNLRKRLAELEKSGEQITTIMLPLVAKLALRKSVPLSEASSLLTQVGYRRTAGQVPVTDDQGGLAFTDVWELTPVPKLVTPAQKAQHLASRMSELSELVVSEMLEDSQTLDVSLAMKATEAARVFAMKLGEAVMARAPHGGGAILDSCAEVSSITFRSV